MTVDLKEKLRAYVEAFNAGDVKRERASVKDHRDWRGEKLLPGGDD